MGLQPCSSTRVDDDMATNSMEDCPVCAYYGRSVCLCGALRASESGDTDGVQDADRGPRRGAHGDGGEAGCEIPDPNYYKDRVRAGDHGGSFDHCYDNGGGYSEWGQHDYRISRR